MFERFTEEARQVVVLAQEEARLMAHNYIGTEHILLALLRDQDTLAGEALAAANVELEEARAAVVRIVRAGEGESAGQIPFTPRAKKVLELSLREALALGFNYIGPEHILLGLLRENEGVAIRVLGEFGVDGEALRTLTLGLMPESGPQPAAPVAGVPFTRPGRSVEDVWTDGVAGLLAGLGSDISVQLERGPDSGDLLLALACAPGTVVERAFRELGVDLDELWARIETARRERQQERTALEREIAEVRAAKEAAIESQDFTRAAELRDSERILREQIRGSVVVRADALIEIRRRLGLAGP